MLRRSGEYLARSSRQLPPPDGPAVHWRGRVPAQHCGSLNEYLYYSLGLLMKTLLQRSKPYSNYLGPYISRFWRPFHGNVVVGILTDGIPWKTILRKQVNVAVVVFFLFCYCHRYYHCY